MADFALRADFAGTIRWSRRGSCGNAGCTEPECCCALCGLPLGVAEDDPRWDAHGDGDCYDWNCPVCSDRVPLMVFRGKGKAAEQAAFHQKCFEEVFESVFLMPAKVGPIAS
jgi:hypothetical protein